MTTMSWMIIAGTYAVLGGLIIWLLVLMALNRKKEIIEIHDTILAPEEMQRHAVEIARNHEIEKKKKGLKGLVPRLDENFSFISDVHTALNKDVKENFATAPVAEWLLDNFYIIEEQVQDIRKNLAKGQNSPLPMLKNGYLNGFPRVYALALEMVSHTDGRIDEKTLISFIEAYQSQVLLSISELWALAIMIRIALIENIRNVCEKVVESQKQWHKAEELYDEITAYAHGHEGELFELLKSRLGALEEIEPSYAEYLVRKLRKQGSKASSVLHFMDVKLSEQNASIDTVTTLEHQLQAARQVSLGNTITSLRLASNIDWAEIFEALSQVERILRQDPSGIYPKMDFESRNYYRREVEKLAEKFDTSEINVARKAVECASEKGNSDNMAIGHIGYYLVGKDRRCLEEKMDYRLAGRSWSTGFSAFGHRLKKRPTLPYIGLVGFLTALITGFFVAYGVRNSAIRPFWYGLLAALAVLLPAWDFSVTLVNCFVSHLYRPYKFPKLELKEGIPESLSTMVIIPTLLPNEKRVRELLEQLEIFYLSNREENLYFALVGDYKDLDRERAEEDERIIRAAMDGVKKLNDRYRQEGREKFYFFHRHRQLNVKQRRWIGWERKRGAINEFNDLLRGDRKTSFSITSTDLAGLPYIKYIITLDADTHLPMGTAKRLIGTLSHPMNKALLDKEKGIVVEGYGLLQPRIGVSVNSANSTLFTRIFAGQGGVDPYTTAVSDVYQDIFGEGIFTGKGIYDVDIFRETLGKTIPQNAILSHDLLEGCYVRAGLLTDVELVDGYPAKYNSYIMRLHRWVRGDWQLVPWLGSRVRNASGALVDNPISAISKWKILDNLRRSMMSPALMLLIILGFGVLPGSLWVWLGLALLILATPIVSYGVNSLLSDKAKFCREKRDSTLICGVKAIFYQTLLMFIFLPYQAYMMADAILRTLVRVFLSKRNLLEWVTAADMEANLKNDPASFWKRMWISILPGVLLAVLAIYLVPAGLPAAAVLLLMWSGSPFAAYYVSKPYSREKEPLTEMEKLELRKLARKTWGYFDTFANSNENYLPPDNYQEDPPKGIAHRTSPTNIGLLLISILSARDFGYMGTLEMLDRIDKTISTVEKMEKWKGHLYNWYDTVTLDTLRPRYVSTVDSGNFIGYLMVLEQGLREYERRPVVDISMLSGIRDTLELAMEQRAGTVGEAETASLDSVVSGESVDLYAWVTALKNIGSNIPAEAGEGRSITPLWGNKLHAMAGSFLREAEELIPLAALPAGISGEGAEYARKLLEKAISQISPNPTLLILSKTYGDILSVIGKVSAKRGFNKKGGDFESMDGKDKAEAEALLELKAMVAAAKERADGALGRLRSLADRVQRLIGGMEFKPLFEPKLQLFSIGYNVEEGALSKCYYDLLASEARQTSYIAVARGEIDQRHWFRLGRMLTMIDGFKGLVSWTGTMFEYLMPLLIMRNYENTLLDETYGFVVKNHIKYGELRKVPWGISESGFSSFDLSLNYQYKAFGVPELGLKRGLGNDLVIAPYATILTLMVDPPAAVKNVRRLKEEGMDGDFGLYEAIDYTKARILKDREGSVVRSFMAHHQGMSVIALNNLINDNTVQKRFHSDPIIRAAELLLQERVPQGVVFNKEHFVESVTGKKSEQEEGEVVRTYGIPDSQLPKVHILSNGSYSVMLTSGGSGYSRSDGIAVSRWKGGLREQAGGIFLYIQNINSNSMWSATFEPCNTVPEKYSVVFSPDKAEFSRRDGNIETHTEVVISPEDNAEIRRVSVTNRSDSVRVIDITSYFEAVLAHPDADAAHPAFSNLFVRTEFVPSHNCLLASRRPRSEKERPMWAVHTVCMEGETIGNIQYETDRFKFIGRNRGLSDPMAMDVDQPLTNTVGAVLDPILCLRRRVRLEPGQTAKASYAVAVSETRKNALELAEKYSDPKAAERAFELSWTRSQVEFRYLGFTPRDVEQYLDMLPQLLFPSPARRVWSSFILGNSKGQPGLWPYGISGDLPIVLLKIAHRDEMELLEWILKAHEYWRMKGITADLVILLEEEAGYRQPLLEQAKDVVSASHARDMQNRMGGVFIRNARQMAEPDVILLNTAARIVLKGSGGCVKEQMQAGITEDVLPGLLEIKPSEARGMEAVEGHGAKEDAPDAGELLYFNGTGGFSPDGKEYVIRLEEGRHTPAPWINVISNKGFGFQVSESGSGYTWAENSRENKLTPWSNDPVSDMPGEVLYLRDETKGVFWSITPIPIRDAGVYTVRHGFGYTAFQHTSHEIEQQLTLFVPREAPVKISRVKLKNLGTSARDLSITFYIRPVMGVDEQGTSPYITTRYDEKSGLLLMKNVYSSDYPGRVAFIGTSLKDISFTGDRYEFIGQNGSTSEPAALKRAGLSGRTGAGYDPCAAIQAKLTLKAGETKEAIFVLGQGQNAEDAGLIAGKFLNAGKVEKEYSQVAEFWRDRLETIQVSTPDTSLDIMLNGWLLYQTTACRMWSRAAFYQSGGAYGFRDQLQDSMAMVYIWPEITREQILLHASRQFVEGDVQHWWHPGAGKGIRTRYSDDLLWLPYVTADYINCTGDWSILDQETLFLESSLLKEGEDERYDVPRVSTMGATLYEHCIRAIEKSLRFGEHGIPLMGSGDWNDGMNTVGNKGRGESVWLGWFLYVLLGRFIPICRARQDEERAERYETLMKDIIHSLEANAWDGSWYRRAYFDDGTPLGSIQNDECRIDSLAQSWAAISGAAKQARTEEAMNAVEKYLVNREEGIIKLLEPPFNEGQLEPGYIKGYVPGVRENGGQYSHAAAWVILAFASLGKGDKAWELYHLINPINHARTPIELSRYRVEPYVMAADVLAVAPHAGRGGWSWYTGAAGWMYRVGIEHLLGIKKREGGLVLDPCIPARWKEFQVTYRLKTTVYEIVFSNPEGVNRGIRSILLDGTPLEPGQAIHLEEDGATHRVEVVMGRGEFNIPPPQEFSYISV